MGSTNNCGPLSNRVVVKVTKGTKFKLYMLIFFSLLLCSRRIRFLYNLSFFLRFLGAGLFLLLLLLILDKIAWKENLFGILNLR